MHDPEPAEADYGHSGPAPAVSILLARLEIARMCHSSRKEQRNNPLIMASTQGVASRVESAMPGTCADNFARDLQEGRRDPEKLRGGVPRAS